MTFLELIPIALKEIGFDIGTPKQHHGSGLQFTLRPGSLSVQAMPNGTYNVLWTTEPEAGIDRQIKDSIDGHVKNAAMHLLQKGDGDLWNEWRNSITKYELDLSLLEFSELRLAGANLRDINFYRTRFCGAELEGVDFKNSEMSFANFSEAKLSFVDFQNCQLRNANFSDAVLNVCALLDGNFEGANFSRAAFPGTSLRRLIIDEHTNFDNSEGIEKGLNGFYSLETESAALLALNPKGNSMKGPNADAVVESMRRARRYIGVSLLLSLLALLVLLGTIDEITLPIIDNVNVSPDEFIWIALASTIGLLLSVRSFLNDTLDGIRFIPDQASVMRISSYPWLLTKYAQNNLEEKIISRLSRVVITLHPVVYLTFVNYSRLKFNFSAANLFDITVLVCALLALALGGWILH